MGRKTRRAGDTSDGHRGGCSLAVLAVLVLGSCSPNEKVVRYKPFFTGVSGAEFHGAEPVNPTAGYTDPARVPDQKIVIDKPDGGKILIAKSVRHMMTHLETCLDNGDDQLLMDQVISEKTKEEFRARGQDPAEILDFLRKNRKDIARFFARMPMGEYTPTVILEQPGDKTWVVRLTGAPAEGLKFTRLWARMEDGNWRFVWVN